MKSVFRHARIWLAQRLWPSDFHPEADFYRITRDLAIAQSAMATTDEERLEAVWSAMDSLYSYHLLHHGMAEDSDARPEGRMGTFDA